MQKSRNKSEKLLERKQLVMNGKGHRHYTRVLPCLGNYLKVRPFQIGLGCSAWIKGHLPEVWIQGPTEQRSGLCLKLPTFALNYIREMLEQAHIANA